MTLLPFHFPNPFGWGRRINRLEIHMSKLRDDFDAAKAELGSAITGLATRIDELPGATDITQADIDALKGDAASLRGLAVADPDIPTEETPDVPGEPEVPVDPDNLPANPEV